jgi:DNA repair protein RadD
MRRTLRDYQSRAIDLLRASLLRGNRRPMLQLPTGAGKTLLAAAVVEMVRAKGNRVVFGVPALELIDQTVAAFEAEGLTEIGVMQANHPRTNPDAPIQVVSVPTLARRELPDTDIVIVDEAHVLAQVIKKWMKENPRLIFVGLSATPWTKGLGKWFDDLIIAETIDGLIRRGYLARYRAFAPQRPDLTGVRVIAGDYHEGDLSVAMNQPHLTNIVVKEWLARAKGLPTLCFGVDRAHAKALAAEFRRAGVNVEYVDGDTPRTERDRIRVAFHSGGCEVVVNVGVLTTGVDWDVRCLMLARPTKSEMLLVQIIGRALRLAEGKDHALLIDLSGSMQDLGLPSSITHPFLDGARGRKHVERARRLPEPCEECSFLMPAKATICADCDHHKRVPTPQERLEIAKQVLLNSDRFAQRRAWGGLLWWGDRYRLSRKWCLRNYYLLFDEWPKKSFRDTPLAPDDQVREWLEATRDVWSANQQQKRELERVSA